jgi:hypothetical protein
VSAGEPAQDEFVDSRDEPPAEEEAAAPEAGGGDDPVFMDDLDAPASSAQPVAAAPPRPAGGPSAPKSGAGPQARPGSDSGRVKALDAAGPMRGSDSGRQSRTSDALKKSSESGGALKRSSESQSLKRPSDAGSGSFKKPSDAGSGSLKKPSDSGVHGRGRAGESARNPAQASGKQKALGPSQRPERTREEDATALAALDARVTGAPQGDQFIGKDLGPFKVEGFIELERGERRYKAILSDQQRPVLLRVFPLLGSWGEEFMRVADRGERVCRVASPGLDSAWFSGRTKEAFYAGFDPPLGRTLTDLLREAPLDEPATLALVEQIARGLSALHGRDMVHAHVSPDVIRQLRPGTWIIEAAGLTRTRPALSFLSAGGDVLGLPGYIAPETIDSGEQTRVSDLYSLGCVAWTAASGKPPFRGDDEVQILLDQLNTEVPPLSPASGKPPSRPFDAIVRKLVGYTPDMRYRDPKDVMVDLRARERGDDIKPFEAAARPQEAAAQKLQGSGIAMFVLAALDVILVLLLVIFVNRVRTIELQDPLVGWELRLPAPPPAEPGAPPAMPPGPR